MTTAIVTVVKMMESLPEPAQDQVVGHLRDHIADLQDERQWDTLLKKTRKQLMAAARQARKEIAEGKARPLELDQL